ncbi:MAG: hypothetical protein U5L07_00120 [Desulfobacterales bacterium]|nr:hypothetical protein [Desulfobacterales bacterium]
MHWRIREELSLADRLRRSYYNLLRDELDQFVLEYALTESYENFKRKGMDYPFVERKELKPRARIPKVEYECQNSFLLIFLEDHIPAKHKKYIRFFDSNRTTKTNLLRSKTLTLKNDFDRTQKFLESVHFFDFLKDLLPVDYALLVQRDTAQPRGKHRYQLSHFHVRIDWPITEAAEDMARRLRYISKDIYEKGEKHAEDIQKKFFEYYGLPDMVGGRRTAAIVAAQFLRRIPCISTVYVSSSESRTLLRYSDRGVTKIVLIKLSQKEMSRVAEANQMTIKEFKENYLIASEDKNGVFLFQVTYSYTSHAIPPDTGKLREIKLESYWLTVGSQQILPRPHNWFYPPLYYNLIYS